MKTKYKLITRSIKEGDIVATDGFDTYTLYFNSKWLIFKNRLFLLKSFKIVGTDYYDVTEMRLYNSAAPTVTEDGFVGATVRLTKQQRDRYWTRLKVDHHAV